MSSIFLFNPETDIVLGLDAVSYTPNKQIALFRKRLSLLPAIYAENGDYILIHDNISEKDISSLPFFDIARTKGVKIIKSEYLKSEKYRDSLLKHGPCSFQPWGWNKGILKLVSNLKLPIDPPVSQSYIDQLRILSNRRLTEVFFRNCVASNIFQTPLYLATTQDVESFIESNPLFCLKAPWSSSGRGVIFSNSYPNEQIMHWAEGVVNTQGGVMGELYYPRKIDFASEWIIKDGRIEYCGLSLFQTDSKGKYCGNRLIPQKEIKRILIDNSDWSDSFLNIQKDFIERYIFPFYSGPLGFDMLVTENGYTNPCVEINIRNTMGHVALQIEKQISDESNHELASMLKGYFRDGIFSVMNFVKTAIV